MYELHRNTQHASSEFDVFFFSIIMVIVWEDQNKAHALKTQMNSIIRTPGLEQEVFKEAESHNEYKRKQCK